MTSMVDKLTSIEESEAAGAWNEFFLNTEAVRSLMNTPERVPEVLLRGRSITNWNGTAIRAAVQIEALTGEALVSADLKDYIDCFLYSLALAAEVDPGPVHLSDRQASVSFALAHVWRESRRRRPAGGPQPTELGFPDNPVGEDGDKEASPLPWEQQKEDLPQDLYQVTARFAAGDLKAFAKAILDSVPYWNSVKARAEENNHREDGRNKSDRVLRTLQQRVLSLQRVYPCLHAGLQEEDLRGLGQQFWWLLMELEKFILEERKKQSIHESIPQENQLFSQEDLKNEKAVSNVNRAGAPGMSPAVSSDGPRFYFQTPSAYRGFKFKRYIPRWGKGRPFGSGQHNQYSVSPPWSFEPEPEGQVCQR